MKSYLVIGTKPWNKTLFDNVLSKFPGTWAYSSWLGQVEAERLNPRYIFFLHQSEMVQTYFTDKYECVCFHPSDLPFGRGGTPIQHQILLGINNARVTAFRMTSKLDAGPIYCQSDLSLLGSLREIFSREMNQIGGMIKYIITHEPTPLPQEGMITTFKRRTPEMSMLPKNGSLKDVYNYIRMLDAETYPPAYIDHPYFGYSFEFHDAELFEDYVEAKVIIKKK